MTKQRHDEYFDKDKYVSIIQIHIRNLNKSDVIWYEDGWDFVVAVVGEQVFRFPRRKDYESKLPIEVKFTDQFITRSPVDIPKLILHHNVDIGNYVTYTFLPGAQFKRKLADTFPVEKKLEIARQIGCFLTAIHSFPVSKAKEIGIEEINSLKSWTDRLEYIKTKVFPYLNQKEQEWTIHVFTRFINLITAYPIQNVMSHSDIMPEHIIVDPKTYTLSGIIDFGDIVIADPAYDFTFLNKYGKDFLEEAYRSYTLPKDPNFEARRQFYEDRLVVTNLEHSIKVGDKNWIDKHLEEFRNYLSRSA